MDSEGKTQTCPCGFSSSNYFDFNRHLKECPENPYTKREPPSAILEVLKDLNLFIRITQNEFDKQIVGEYETRKAIFLSLCSVWVEGAQINTLVNSASSAGKSYICKKICKIFPKETVEFRTKISPQAFTYWHDSNAEPDWSWDGKICYLEDVSDVVINSDTFKIMCSEGSEATVVVRQKAIDIKIIGKPCLIVTTANANPSFELMNRFNVISLDESEEQTKAIMNFQATRKEGQASNDYDGSITDALGYLSRVKVRIPFASKITKHFPSHNIRTRRDFERFFNLIEASAALHQYQREKKDRLVVASRQDYELAKDAMGYIMRKANPGLTHKQTKAYDTCLACSNNASLEPKGFTVKEAWAKNPFCTERMWYDHIKVLTELGLLDVRLEKREGSDRDVSVYYLKQMKVGINLPAFDAL